MSWKNIYPWSVSKCRYHNHRYRLHCTSHFRASHVVLILWSQALHRMVLSERRDKRQRDGEDLRALPPPLHPQRTHNFISSPHFYAFMSSRKSSRKIFFWLIRISLYCPYHSMTQWQEPYHFVRYHRYQCHVLHVMCHVHSSVTHTNHQRMSRLISRRSSLCMEVVGGLYTILPFYSCCSINWFEFVLCSIWLHLDIYHQFSIHCCVSSVQGPIMRDPLMVRGDVILIRWNDHSIDAETARDVKEHLILRLP